MFDAYVMEKQAAGDWEQVGYTGPGSQKDKTSSATQVIKYFEAANNVWTAQPLGALNDCTTSMTWTITPTIDGTNVRYVTGGDTQCKSLTPSWDNLSRNTK